MGRINTEEAEAIQILLQTLKDKFGVEYNYAKGEGRFPGKEFVIKGITIEKVMPWWLRIITNKPLWKIEIDIAHVKHGYLLGESPTANNFNLGKAIQSIVDALNNKFK